MPTLFEMKAERKAELDAAEAILARAEKETNRSLTAAENSLVDEHLATVKKLNPQIEHIESLNTIRQYDPIALLSGRLVRPGKADAYDEGGRTGEHPKAQALKNNFSVWARHAIGNLTGLGLDGEIMAANPSGIISIGSGTGLDSVNFAVPVDVLPFMKSYFAFAPFEKAGSFVLSTDHMRNINLPVVAAGAPPSSYAEAQGPASGAAGSQPFGMSGFTFGANKKSRQVIASWESLQSTEVPLSPVIMDELLAAIANALTQDATTALYNALTAPPNFTIVGGVAPLQIGGSGVQADTYGQLTALRHSLVEGFEDPTNCWMLSRSSLGVIRNTRASTSGVVMFDPENDLILGRPYVVNEFFDSVCGAGFVAYGNWKRGAWLRRTPLLTRILQELYWLSNEIGFLVTQWADNHFLAELVGAAQPPTNQPIYFTKLPSGLLP
jgi:HK97 family phage major capsid protein